MLKNYIKIAFRNIRRHFTYSFINIAGLAVGLASAIVIGLWVYQEWSYDRHFENSDRIYRVGVNFYNIGDMAPGPERFTRSAQKFPEVEIAASLDYQGEIIVNAGNREFKESDAFFADSGYFDLFSYVFLEGDPQTALDAPNTVVLSEKTARKYFHGAPALGKTLQVGEEKVVYTVTGVIKESTTHSHIPAKLWFRLDGEPSSSWTSANYYNYVLLNEEISEVQFTDRLNRFIKNKIYPTLSLNQPYEDWIQTDAAYRFIVMPLRDIHLKSSLRFELTPGGNGENVTIFALVAVFIILTAAVNFVNITTARSLSRAKEVGIRKTLGTGRAALLGQFLAESILICLLALIIAVGLAELFLAAFEQFTGMNLLDGLYNEVGQLGSIVLAVSLIGVLSGLYPAVYLSGFMPVTALKNKFTASGNSLFRSGLVLVQFVISVVLLICMGQIYRQLKFMQDKDPGLETKNVLVIQNAGQLGNQQEAFRNELEKKSGIGQISINSRIPAGNRVLMGTFKTPVMTDGLPVQTFRGDYNYLSVIGFRLKEGRNFFRDQTSDSSAVILNESAVRALELQEPVGTILSRGDREFQVIGVVNDFNFESLRNRVEPAAILLDTDGGPRIAAKIKSADVSGLLSGIRDLWDSFQTGEPIDYYFLDENYAQLVQKEKALSRAIMLFAVLAIIISCLGLYGLSAYMCEQRIKEVGIRKMLGAKIPDILVLLNKNLLKPVAPAVLLAIPVSLVAMRSWLNNFAYRIEISPGIFAAACFVALAIALVTVSWQSVRAAHTNPVESLRSE